MFFLPLKAISKLLSFRFPWVTIFIILANILVFCVYNIGLAPDFDIKKIVFFPSDLAEGRYFSLFTAMFAHANLMHILSNMYFLWIFGNRLERMVGAWRYIFIYLASGIAGSLLFSITATDSAGLLGASGAISGVMGAFMVVLPKDDIKFFTWLFIRYYISLVPAWIAVSYFLVINVWSLVTSGNTSSVAYMTHIGGILAGFALGWILIMIAGGKNRVFGKVVFVDVSDGTAEFLKKAFFRKRWNVVALSALEDFNVYLSKFPINAIVVDYRLVSVIGEDFFSGLVEDQKYGRVPIVILADHPSYKYWIEEHHGKYFQYVSGKNVAQDEIVQHVSFLLRGGKMKSDGPAPGSSEAIKNFDEGRMLNPLV